MFIPKFTGEEKTEHKLPDKMYKVEIPIIGHNYVPLFTPRWSKNGPDCFTK